MFKEAIDENDMFRAVEKFTYLKGYVTRDAERSGSYQVELHNCI